MGSKYFYSPIRCANGIFSLHTRGNLWPRLNEKYFFFLSVAAATLAYVYSFFFLRNFFWLRRELRSPLISVFCVCVVTNVGDFLFCVSVKFLEVIKPFCSILPEIAKPERKVSSVCVGWVP